MGEEKKTRRVPLRVSPSEYRTIKQKAGEASMSVSNYMRARALGKPVMSTADKQTINELRRLGGLLKYFYNEGRVHPNQSADALRELIAAIKRIGRVGE